MKVSIKVYSTVTKYTSLETLITAKGVKYLQNIGGTCYIVTYI